MTALPAPGMRASDQERHEAVLALSDHFADGRLDLEEFQARMGRAQSVTYLHELDPLFVDLPSRRAAPPSRASRSADPRWAERDWRRRPPRFLAVVPLLVVAAVVLAFVTDNAHLLFWLIPLGFFLKHRAWHHHRGPVAWHQAPPRLPR